MSVDLWDDAGPFVYQHLPESCLAAFFTEERDMLQISKDADGYWLSDTRSQGASRYDTLEAAKAAGDEAIAEAEARQDALLLDEAGLPGDSWKVSYVDGLRFEQKDGSLWIAAGGDGMSSCQSWELYDGDDPVVENARDMATVVAKVRARS